MELYSFFVSMIISLLSFIRSITPLARPAVSRINDGPSNPDTLKKQCAVSLTQFLQGISYKYPGIHFDHTLKKKVEDSMRDAGLSSEMLERIQPYIGSSVNIALTCYAHTSPKVQEAVALYTSYAITIDDLGHEFNNEMKAFVSNLLCGQPSESVILRGFLNVLDSNSSQFGQFGGNMIVKSSLDFICGCYLEIERECRESHNTSSMHDTAKAPEYAEYLRIKTGVAEAYAFFLFAEELFVEDELLHAYLPAIPYIVQYFNYVNDLFSFYKEANEKANYVNNYAAAHNISPLESLDVLCKRTVHIYHTIRAILEPNEALNHAVQ